MWGLHEKVKRLSKLAYQIAMRIKLCTGRAMFFSAGTMQWRRGPRANVRRAFCLIATTLSYRVNTARYTFLHPYKLWLLPRQKPVNTTGCYGKEKSNQT